MTKKEFAEIAIMLKNAYKQKNFMSTEDEWKVWYDCLKDRQFFCLKEAAMQWVQHNRFPPTIAELLELYNKIILKAESSGGLDRFSLLTDEFREELENQGVIVGQSLSLGNATDKQIKRLQDAGVL
ncbi:replicative helicase loader/inhibitor [Lacrimispora brassicae]